MNRQPPAPARSVAVFPCGLAPHRPPFCCHPWGVVRSATHPLQRHSAPSPPCSQATQGGSSAPFCCKACSAPLPRPHGRQQPIPTHPGGIGTIMMGRYASSHLTTAAHPTMVAQLTTAAHPTISRV